MQRYGPDVAPVTESRLRCLLASARTAQFQQTGGGPGATSSRCTLILAARSWASAARSASGIPSVSDAVAAASASAGVEHRRPLRSTRCWRVPQLALQQRILGGRSLGAWTETAVA